jgi:lysophospholipase L1-like esterase
MRGPALVLAVMVALLVAGAATASPERVGYPNSIASTGDSITRAFNTGLIPFTDATGNSWSTGSSSTVRSHYSRILAANPGIAGHSHNDAKTGARMIDLPGQATVAVSNGAEYVTILMGANDVCRSSEDAMTPVADFRAQFRNGLQTLSQGLPDARIYVVSIPDIYRLWALLKNNFWARATWSTAGICQSMLARPLSTAQADVERRQRVRQRNIDFNTELAQGCALYVHCRFDGNAVFNTAFTTSDVSTRDYFHPSLAGQTKLASVTWAAGYDFSDATAPESQATPTQTASGTDVTLTATDDVAVSGIEYKLGGSGYSRYTSTISVPSGTTLTYRAVDVNGNTEASHSLVG